MELDLYLKPLVLLTQYEKHRNDMPEEHLNIYNLKVCRVQNVRNARNFQQLLLNHGLVYNYSSLAWEFKGSVCGHNQPN